VAAIPVPAAPKHLNGPEGFELGGILLKGITIRNSNKRLHDLWFCSGEINSPRWSFLENVKICHFV
jgi:hypothetical protein